MISKFAVIPVTSCTCEGSFSKLSKLKTKLQSVMTQERLSSLMVPYIEQKLATAVNFNAVIDEFKNMVAFERRMNL